MNVIGWYNLFRMYENGILVSMQKAICAKSGVPTETLPGSCRFWREVK